MKRVAAILGVVLGAQAGLVQAASEDYTLDPKHTFPSFEADHMGISVWRGKLNSTSGHVALDRAAGTGTVTVTMDLNSVDFGLADLDAWARGKQFFDTEHYPTAEYRGTLTDFVGGSPTRVTGTLTLHGVTRPVDLKLNSFRCIQHPLLKRDYCGADAYAVFDRSEFGLTAGKDYGFRMDVTLRIQVEAVADR
ncbi:MAG: polyisoprenoid-binding protein [Proteobacteria bacterium]|nr:polyisoprenoid-binding protein [Pseudomonadota bacterium]